MKNLKKICTVLALVTFSSIGCSSTLAQKEASEVSANVASIIENPVAGEKVTLQGKIVNKIEDCYVFSDGNNKILVHFHNDDVAYNPQETVEISGVVEHGIMPGSHHFEEGHNHGNISMDTMIMVDRVQVIGTNEEN